MERKPKNPMGMRCARNAAVQSAAYKENSRISLFVTLMVGVAAGAAAFWLLAVPAIKQGIYREANQQIVQYSESLAAREQSLPESRVRPRNPGM